MYALVLSDSIFTSTFLSQGLRYENVQSVPFSFYNFNPNSIDMNEFDCAIIRVENQIDEKIELLSSIVESLSTKPLYLIKPSSLNIPIIKKNVIITEKGTSMRQIAYDMKKRINQSIDKYKEKKLRVSNLSLDLQRRIATRFNEKFTLKNKEFHLLEFLMRNTEVIFNRQKILEQVWDRNTDMFTNTIDVHINILRRKLDYKKNFKLIETIYCHGYIMHSKPFA